MQVVSRYFFALLALVLLSAACDDNGVGPGPVPSPVTGWQLHSTGADMVALAVTGSGGAMTAGDLPGTILHAEGSLWRPHGYPSASPVAGLCGLAGFGAR